ncbi:hypothetical protein PMIN05_004499 [Paraphaeosphaeria minitans]
MCDEKRRQFQRIGLSSRPSVAARIKSSRRARRTHRKGRLDALSSVCRGAPLSPQRAMPFLTFSLPLHQGQATHNFSRITTTRSVAMRLAAVENGAPQPD